MLLHLITFYIVNTDEDIHYHTKKICKCNVLLYYLIEYVKKRVIELCGVFGCISSSIIMCPDVITASYADLSLKCLLFSVA